MGYTTVNGISLQIMPRYAAPIMNTMIKRWSNFESLALFENPLGMVYTL